MSFGTPLSHRHDPDTSKQAAASMKEVARTHRDAVMGALRVLGRAGACRIGKHIDRPAQEVRKRLTELHQEHLIARTDTTETTPSGRKEAVWTIA